MLIQSAGYLKKKIQSAGSAEKNIPSSRKKGKNCTWKEIERFGKLRACTSFPNFVCACFLHSRDFYFRAPGSLVVLSFFQPLNFFSVFPSL
jgi:hypothetical protein